MEFTSPEAESRYAALVRVAATAVVGLDFDGVLSPIVADPARAHIHPEARDVLVALAEQVAAVAVITGRPARQALDLGGLEEVGNAVGDAGKDLYVFGQYGNERWSSTNRRIIAPRPPAGLATFERELPRALRRLDAGEAFVEDKGLAVAVHTRRLPDSDDAFARLLPELEKLAERHDLVLEPGHQVIEVRSSGMHKGIAVRTIVDEIGAEGFLYAGDDLGDIEAFQAVEELGDDGVVAPLRVCADPAPGSRLRPIADLVVEGPAGVLDLLRRLTDDARALRA